MTPTTSTSTNGSSLNGVWFRGCTAALDVDDVLDNPRSGDCAVLGDVADEDQPRSAGTAGGDGTAPDVPTRHGAVVAGSLGTGTARIEAGPDPSEPEAPLAEG